MYDYTGDMDKFVKKLEAAGVSKEELDIEKFSGLTIRELNWLVDSTIQRHKALERGTDRKNGRNFIIYFGSVVFYM